MLAARERFLHWPLAFAEVFARERPGFDALVGNPPWDEISSQPVPPPPLVEAIDEEYVGVVCWMAVLPAA